MNKPSKRTAEDWRELAVKLFNEAEGVELYESLHAAELYAKAGAAAAIATMLKREPSRKVSSAKRNLGPL